MKSSLSQQQNNKKLNNTQSKTKKCQVKKKKKMPCPQNKKSIAQLSAQVATQEVSLKHYWEGGTEVQRSQIFFFFVKG